MSLADKKCVPCDGGTPKLTGAQIKSLSSELSDWQVDNDTKLQRKIKTKDFMASLNMANKIGEIAEEQGHHPDLTVRWGELGIELWTHAVDGLTESDFILAAKIDRLV
jgi:4a-hydroxytetrahydrobiopterin dehydratase